MKHRGFTLIELSIVIIIIGLIAGAIFVGRDLIEAAAIHAQISQIQKYQAAVNTFRVKYDCLPGDCAAAAAFGFPARGTTPGTGDGNGFIEGWEIGAPPGGQGVIGSGGYLSGGGESLLFWEDLSQAGLIAGNFHTASATAHPWVSPNTGRGDGTTLDNYMPQGKIGRGNYVYVWSGGTCAPLSSNGGECDSPASNGINYFAIAIPVNVQNGYLADQPGLTVQEAFSIDTKVDDGLPQSGKVTTLFVDDDGNNEVDWIGGIAPSPIFTNLLSGHGPGNPTNVVPTANTCVDGAPPREYTTSINQGIGPNCALSFEFE